MAFSTLLACMRINRPNADLLAVVSDMAEQFGSSVIGLVAKQASAPLYARGVGPFEPPEHDLQAFMEHASAAEAEFRGALTKIGTLEWRPQLTIGPAYEQVANEARSADLVIAPIDDQDLSFLASGQTRLGDLVLRLGRPVLAVPSGASGLELNEVLVCWKTSGRRAGPSPTQCRFCSRAGMSTWSKSSRPMEWTSRVDALIGSAIGSPETASSRVARRRSRPGPRPGNFRRSPGISRPI